VLNVDQVDRQQSFFVAGGDPQLGVELIERIRAKGIQLTGQHLLIAPTLAELAEVAESQLAAPSRRERSAGAQDGRIKLRREPDGRIIAWR
jgi:aryl carrier-like protein